MNDVFKITHILTMNDVFKKTNNNK